MEYSPEEIRELIEHVTRLRAESQRLQEEAERICRLIRSERAEEPQNDTGPPNE